MSIFSSFDALSAEILGQKVNHSWAPPTSDNKQPRGAGVGPIVSDRNIAVSVSPPSTSVTSKLNKTEEAAPPSSSSKSPSRPRRPKFAPELDGVYCFETIPPYWFFYINSKKIEILCSRQLSWHYWLYNLLNWKTFNSWFLSVFFLVISPFTVIHIKYSLVTLNNEIWMNQKLKNFRSFLN